MPKIFWAWSTSKTGNSKKRGARSKKLSASCLTSSINHSNLGFSLAVTGDLNSAEEQARKAIQLDPANLKAKSLLELLLHARRAGKR